MLREIVIFGLSAAVAAAQAGDRVYTAEQTSNTVSVIDPFANKLLGSIRLGEDVPVALSPLYRGELLVHGLGFSPDHKTLAVVSIGSNSVTLVDTETNAIRGRVYVGRSPHEAFFRPDGLELWLAVRGENYVSVIDPKSRKEIRRIETANGPGMVLFRPDGQHAFVPSSFTPEMDVIDTGTYRVLARVKQASDFSPNLAVDQDEVWLTLKDSGKTQIVSASPPFHTLAVLETGPITNHVTLVNNSRGRFAYITVGGADQVLVYRRQSGSAPELVATVKTGDLPHGIWGAGDGNHVYVGLENGDAVQSIDTSTNQVTATIAVGQLPQALVYVPGAVHLEATLHARR
jgi:YVTN family beta-propeller protein